MPPLFHPLRLKNAHVIALCCCPAGLVQIDLQQFIARATAVRPNQMTRTLAGSQVSGVSFFCVEIVFPALFRVLFCESCAVLFCSIYIFFLQFCRAALFWQDEKEATRSSTLFSLWPGGNFISSWLRSHRSALSFRFHLSAKHKAKTKSGPVRGCYAIKPRNQNAR